MNRKLTRAAALFFISLLILWFAHFLNSRSFTRDEFREDALLFRRLHFQNELSKATTQEQMTAFLEKREAFEVKKMEQIGLRFRPGQQNQVAWSGEEFQTPLALVYVHGFSASPLELEPVISILAKRLKANVVFTRLAAHGFQPASSSEIIDGFATVRARDWAQNVDEALAVGEKVGRRVVLMGMSTGGPLVLDAYERWMKSSSSSQIAGLVLLSPNYGLSAWGGFLLEGSLGPLFARWILGTHREFQPENPLHAERWTPRYRSEGLGAMMTAVARAREIDASSWTVPILTVYTKNDDVVLVSAIEKKVSEMPPGSELIAWPLARRHELASAAFNPEAAPLLAELLFNWVQRRIDSVVKE